MEKEAINISTENKLICQICGKEYKYYNGFSQHIGRHCSHKDYYDKYLKKDNEGTCRYCGKPTKFINLKNGYTKFCPNSCALNYYNENLTFEQKTTKSKKAKQTCLERYGVDNPSKSNQVKEKISKANKANKDSRIKKTKQTKKERYGDENYNNIKKNKQTCLEKYGVEYQWQRKKIIDKNHSDEVINKQRKSRTNTNIEKYGMKVPTAYIEASHTKECVEKQKINRTETNLKKYGVENTFQSEEKKDKIKKTNLVKYGVENVFELEEFRNWKKACNTMRENGNYSSYEDLFEILCKENNVKYVHQYKEERYPYFCDFYLPDYDVFVEINGWWHHNDHWFDKNNKDDLKEVEELKKLATNDTNQYLAAIVLWNKKDIEKWFELNCPMGYDWKYEYTWKESSK